jgi:EamA domain-containing membrane protein RarD
MRRTYLILAVVGYAITCGLMFKVSWETGNWLFWLDPAASTAGVLANGYSTTLVVDLFLILPTAFVWMFDAARRAGMPKPWLYVVLTMLFGLAGTLPLFLYVREGARQPGAEAGTASLRALA